MADRRRERRPLGPGPDAVPLADALGLAQGRRDRAAAARLPTSRSLDPELPLRGGARLAQAVPFALEEQLASDVEGLHFAIGAARTRRPAARPSPSSPAA